MFRTKQDVDEHVTEVFRNIKNEYQRNLKCYQIAKLYFKFKDYKSAIKYVNRYILINSNSAAAHRLLGECYLGCNLKLKALESFKTSLVLNGSQQDLVLKICILLMDPDVAAVTPKAAYWLERAESLFPTNPVVLQLREHLLESNLGDKQDTGQLEKLILSEVNARPTDVSVRIRLLNFFLDTQRFKLAYQHALEVEDKKTFSRDLKWYDCLCNLVQVYEKVNGGLGFSFFIRKIIFLEKRVELFMQEFQEETKTLSECSEALFVFDQSLHSLSKIETSQEDAPFFNEFMKHMSAQLSFHLATLILKRAKKEYGIWLKAIRTASPLLLQASQSTMDLEEPLCTFWTRKNNLEGEIKQLNKSANLRVSQAGQILHSWFQSKVSKFLEKVSQYCCGKWQNQAYQDIFYNKEHQQAAKTSHFVNDSFFASVPMRVLNEAELIVFAEASQSAYPDSLHHLVWLGLSYCNSNCQLSHDFRCVIVPDLQFTTANLSQTGAETLNQLDVDAFLCASVICAKSAMPNISSGNRPNKLPVNITEELCSSAQSDWWVAVNKTYTNQIIENVSQVRLIIKKGIEAVRVWGQHGLHPKVIVMLAKWFQERAAKSKNNSEVNGLKDRAHLYWSAAIPLLEKIEKNQVHEIPNRLFDYRGKDLTTNEIKGYLEDGKLFLACRLMKQGKYDQAIEAFQSLKSPFATFYQALIYEKLASEEVNLRPESITSENRSRHIILLTRARDAFHLTIDRLRCPSVDPNHPLNSQVQDHLEQVEKQLAVIDPDSNLNRNAESQSDETDTGAGPLSPEVDENLESGLNVFSTNHSLSLKNHSPLRSLKPAKYNVRYEARPSPERLDAQLRHLVQANSNGLQAIVEQLREIKSTMQMELKDLGCVTRDLLAEMKRWYDRLEVMSKKATDIIKPEDLVAFRDEDYDDLSQLSQQYSPYQNCTVNRQGTSTVTYGTPAPSSVTSVPTIFTTPENPLIPSSIDPSLLLHQSLGYYAPGTPSADGQNTADFRASGIQKGIPFVRNSFTAMDATAAVSTTKLQSPNAVITYSNNMPIFTSTATPPVSVTVPQQHIRSPMFVATQNPPTGQTYSFPITTPSQAQLSKKSSAETANALATTTSVTMSPLQTAPSSTTKLSKDIELGHDEGLRLAKVTSANEATKSTPPTQLKAKECKTCKGRIEGNADECFICEYRNKPGTNLNLGGFSLNPSPFVNSAELNQSQENPKEIVNQNPPAQLFLSSAAVPHKAQSETQKTQLNTLTSTLVGGQVTSSTAGSENLFSSVKPDPNSFKKDENKDFEGKNSLVFGYLNTTKSEESNTNKNNNTEGGDDDEEEEVEEFVPAKEFTPVVSLPPLVDVKTGEENDVVLYDERAELLRFDRNLKAWKERGVGQMKLLLNSESGKVRLIMRRELVLKVCCNHYLDVNMEFKRLTTSKKALAWHAQDYSEGELKSELLALKFASPESMIKFESAVKKAQSEMKTGQIKATGPKESSQERPRDLKPLSELFKPKPGSWECSNCLIRNDESASKCVSCEAPKQPGTGNPENAKSSDLGKGLTLTPTTKFTFGIPQTSQTTSVTSTVFTSTSTFRPPSFTFGISKPNVGVNSTAVVTHPGTGSLFDSPFQTTSSFAPSIVKTPETSSATSNSGFSLTPTAPFSTPKLNAPSGNAKLDVTQNFTFGQTTPQTSSSTAPSFSLALPKFTFAPSITSTEGSIFGDKNFVFNFSMTDKSKSESQNKKSTTFTETDLKADEKGAFEFSFGGVKAPQTENCLNSSLEVTDEEPEEEEEDDGDNSVVRPVVPLPEKVAPHTGEEDEDVLYQNRAKLYRFSNKEWKEKGLGEVKILRHKINNKIRLLMRSETILKVCLNHYVNSNIQFSPKDEKTWTWSAGDFSEGEVRYDTFAIRFKTPEMAGEFKKVLDAVRTDPLPSSLDLSGSSNVEKTEISKGSFSNSREEDVLIVYEKKVTPELQEKANKLLLPDNFYAYLEAPDCPGCPGCNDDDDADDSDTPDPTLQVSSSPLAKKGC